MHKGRSIGIFLLEGEPNGIRIANISMSTIQAIAFRRNELRRVRETFPDIERPGVYILIGEDETIREGTKSDRQVAYIGESGTVGRRLHHHYSNKIEDSSKYFWTDTIALISKDESLTKSHAMYIESHLIPSVSENPRWTTPNKRRPSNDAGGLPLPDRVAMDEFIRQAKMLVGVLGWDMFREVRGDAQGEDTLDIHEELSETMDSPMFYCKGEEGEFEARMKVSTSGEHVVQAGSKARLKEVESLSFGKKALRRMLQESGVLREEGGFLVFTSDYNFLSPSAAGDTVSGRSGNGRTLWKLCEDKTTTYAEWAEDVTID